MRSTRWLAILGVAALLAAGCGGDDEPAGGGGGADATATAPPAETTAAPEDGGEDEGEGQQTFASTCGSCHTLSAAGTSGTVGPNLDDLKPSRDQVLTAIQTGPGAMPENLLSGADAEAVADFVSSSAGG